MPCRASQQFAKRLGIFDRVQRSVFKQVVVCNHVKPRRVGVIAAPEGIGDDFTPGLVPVRVLFGVTNAVDAENLGGYHILESRRRPSKARGRYLGPELINGKYVGLRTPASSTDFDVFRSFFSQLSSKNSMAAKTPTRGSPASGHKAPFPQRFPKSLIPREAAGLIRVNCFLPASDRRCQDGIG